MDKSALLGSIVMQRLGGCWQELLAEFEVAFVTFLYGQSLEGNAPFVITLFSFLSEAQ